MTSTSDQQSRDDAGFTLIELLVALLLSVLFALALAPLWVNLQKSHVEAADRAAAVTQARVAVSRFESDLRQASARGRTQTNAGALLRATRHELVLLTAAAGGEPNLVEWELVDGRLLRRHGEWSGVRPQPGSHAAYASSKTMLEGVGGTAAFAYLGLGQPREDIAPADLPLVTAVQLHLSLQGPGNRATTAVETLGGLGR